MTTETTTSGWLLVIASALVLLGAGVIAYTRSARAERKTLRVENALLVEGRNMWRTDCLDALDENDRLRADNARLNNHPAVRFDRELDVSLDIAAHTVAADARLSSVAPVFEFPTQRKAVE